MMMIDVKQDTDALLGWEYMYSHAAFSENCDNFISIIILW